MVFAARFMMDHASGIMYAFSAGRQEISGGTAPIEDLAKLESRDQMLSSNGLMGMEDWIHRQGRPRVVPLARDSSLHQRLKVGDRGDDHRLEAEFMLLLGRRHRPPPTLLQVHYLFLVTMHVYSLTQGLHTLLFHVGMLHESG